MTVQKADKERVVQELASRLASADSLIVADYRGLTNGQLAALRTECSSTAQVPW
jgi:ribosomal protein L10